MTTIHGRTSTVSRPLCTAGSGALEHAHRQSYVDEYTFRYNHRDDAAPMFAVIKHRMAKVRHGDYGTYAPIG